MRRQKRWVQVRSMHIPGMLDVLQCTTVNRVAERVFTTFCGSSVLYAMCDIGASEPGAFIINSIVSA